VDVKSIVREGTTDDVRCSDRSGAHRNPRTMERPTDHSRGVTNGDGEPAQLMDDLAMMIGPGDVTRCRRIGAGKTQRPRNESLSCGTTRWRFQARPLRSRQSKSLFAVSAADMRT